ncbi:MAG: DUF5320 domain-containing protein [Tenuifilaceae bacterium]|jgi:hypothetical protein|nr:DUF5320 domain-containing protein [Tenuifilaceae bacterium]
MPGLNQTGPVGQGPMTGRRMGRCTNYGAGRKGQPIIDNTNENSPESPIITTGFGRGGRGRGRGRGMGMQNRFRGDF